MPRGSVAVGFVDRAVALLWRSGLDAADRVDRISHGDAYCTTLTRTETRGHIIDSVCLHIHRVTNTLLANSPRKEPRKTGRINPQFGLGGALVYGLIGKMIAVPGKRDELTKILIKGVGGMPGCLSYVVAKDGTDPNALWVTEVWRSEADHRASLRLPEVQEAIAKGKPLIAGFGERFETEPVGGHGL